MATEIEHKYLVKADLWQEVTPHASVEVKQAYLVTDPDKTIRVRTMGDQAFITIKGKASGASRAEYEYEIPLQDAHELIHKFSSNLIEKVRHYVLHDTKTWEVDEFRGLNKGLVVAEIELATEEETYALPAWIDKNVTHDHRDANSNLVSDPYINW